MTTNTRKRQPVRKDAPMTMTEAHWAILRYVGWLQRAYQHGLNPSPALTSMDEEYLALVNAGYLERHDDGYWLTDEGEKAIESGVTP